MRSDGILAFVQVGDLHLTGPDAKNVQDFRSALAEIDAVTGIDFAFLPGDNADDGRPDQYALLRAALDGLRLPVHVISGDHDMESGGLDAFYAGLGVPQLPYAAVVSGNRCLFLDICGPGTGGLDFRLGTGQIAWLEGEMRAAEEAGQDCALFMHSYPADLTGAGEAARVANLVHGGPVRLVAIGHTHYNELANDGRTVYAATRSTGQIEEGPVGYAVAAIDRGSVAWRFKELGRPWPFVLITAPVDRRLAHADARPVAGPTEIRALVLGPGPLACACSIDGGPWHPMHRAEGERCHRAVLDWPPGARRLSVRARSGEGLLDVDAVEPFCDPAGQVRARGIGSDADAVGAWPEKGVLGTQLGPNRNGRQW